MSLQLIIIVAILLVVLFSGLPVGFGLCLLGILTINFLIGDFVTVTGDLFWSNASAFTLSAIPLYVFMGAVIQYSGYSEQLFRGLAPLATRLPGGLLHANIAACAVFSAINGSSTATSAAIGSITIKQMERRGYETGTALATVAAGGTLGILIPPSIGMIIYATIVQESVGAIFLAGFLPGFMLAALFSISILARVLITPSIAPKEPGIWKGLGNAIGQLRYVVPMVIIAIVVLGGFYSGLVTPTEAGALGCFGALLMALGNKTLSWQLMRLALFDSVRIACMVMLILIGGGLVSFALAYLRLPAMASEAIRALNLSPIVLMLVLYVFYSLLGCVLDGTSMMVVTLPIVYPMVANAGFSLVWFGVVMMILVELGCITPPLGMNLFVVQGMSGKPFGAIVKGIMPFVIAMWVMLLVLLFVPNLALWLPSTMRVR